MPRQVTLILAAVAAVTPFAFAEDWPQWRGPNRNGIYTGPEIVASFPRTGPPALWSRDVGAGLGEGGGDDLAQAFAAAGDQGALVGQFEGVEDGGGHGFLCRWLCCSSGGRPTR